MTDSRLNYFEQELSNIGLKLQRAELKVQESSRDAFCAKLELDRAKKNYQDCMENMRQDQAKHLEIKKFFDQIRQMYLQVRDQNVKNQ